VSERWEAAKDLRSAANTLRAASVSERAEAAGTGGYCKKAFNRPEDFLANRKAPERRHNLAQGDAKPWFIDIKSRAPQGAPQAPYFFWIRR
jgi:hypothetical protein